MSTARAATEVVEAAWAAPAERAVADLESAASYVRSSYFERAVFNAVSAAVQAAQKMIDTVPAAMRFHDGKDDWQDFAVHGAEALGYAFGVGGTSQAAAMARYLKRYNDGEEAPANPAEFTYDMVRGKKKDHP